MSGGARRAWLFLLAGVAAAQPIHLRLEGWEAAISPESLAISARLDGKQGELLIAAASEKKFPAQNLAKTPNSVQWSIPTLGMTVRISSIGSRLHVRFDTTQEQKFTWPVSGVDPRISALIYPDGEGLYIPLDDAFWKQQLSDGFCRDTHGGISMPFWSYLADGGTFTYLALTDLETELCFSQRGGRLSTYGVHSFRKRDGLAPYEMEIWPGGASPVSPAVEYRQWLVEHGQYVPLDQKIGRNPAVAGLLGAIHAYVYGDGATIPFLEALNRSGIDRFWLGLQKLDGAAEFIATAKQFGYLVGPYDSFANIQDPASSDSRSSVWEGLYKSGCIVNERGQIHTGFAGRGCELSSEALELAEPVKHQMADRVKANAASGINSYFLDVDAFGELFDDYSKAHPMTPAKDRQNRLKRMRYISDTAKLVLGSESGVGWSAPVIAFGHGIESVQGSILWTLQKDKEKFGRWWPPERPGVFFKPVNPGADFKKAKYDPTYRLPLFQAAFHGSVIGTDRWETSFTKFPELMETRALLELLYNVPSIWALDLKQLRQYGKSLTGLYQFFSPIHKRIGGKPLSDFKWLTPDRSVQQTNFAGEIALTANFGEAAYRSIPAKCVEANWIKEGRKQLFCPASSR